MGVSIFLTAMTIVMIVIGAFAIVATIILFFMLIVSGMSECVRPLLIALGVTVGSLVASSFLSNGANDVAPAIKNEITDLRVIGLKSTVDNKTIILDGSETITITYDEDTKRSATVIVDRMGNSKIETTNIVEAAHSDDAILYCVEADRSPEQIERYRTQHFTSWTDAKLDNAHIYTIQVNDTSNYSINDIVKGYPVKDKNYHAFGPFYTYALIDDKTASASSIE